MCYGYSTETILQIKKFLLLKMLKPLVWILKHPGLMFADNLHIRDLLKGKYLIKDICACSCFDLKKAYISPYHALILFENRVLKGK